jgi:uncharacterized iron-regulated membrane protein
VSRAKRVLYLTHRWAGIALCLLFAMWFVSGVVMMYVGYPKLTPAERLLRLPELRSSLQGRRPLSPQDALARAGLSPQGVRTLSLAAASGGEPVYLATVASAQGAATGPKTSTGHRHAKDQVVAVHALTGERVLGSEARALQSATAFAQGLGSAAPRVLGQVQEDAFTHSRSLDAHRPLHKLALGDAADTWVWVSSATGEVVRDASRWERGWNYLGAWIHWLYPLRGNWFDPYWADIVVWLSVAGVVLAVSGTVVGLLRWRFQGRYANGARTPYRQPWMRWHHLTGLAFAALTLTWIFSGLMSMNPWKVFDAGAPPLAQAAYQSGDPSARQGLDLRRYGRDLDAALTLADATGQPSRELVWQPVKGEPLMVARSATGQPTLINLASAATHLRLAFTPQALATQAQSLVPGAPIASVEVLERHDFYYYERAAHTMLGHLDRPLPALRVRFDDPHQTWVHLDLKTGQVLGKLDSRGRVKRVLFALLHSWDWLPLLDNRPAWDLLVILGSLGGLALSLTGTALGLRRLARRPVWTQRASPHVKPVPPTPKGNEGSISSA